MMDEQSAPAPVAGFHGETVTALRRSAVNHPRKVVEVSLKAWDDFVLPALAEELNGDAQAERDRILWELRRPCQGRVIVSADERPQCRLNHGHIGGCSTFEAFVSVSMERLLEILNG